MASTRVPLPSQASEIEPTRPTGAAKIGTLVKIRPQAPLELPKTDAANPTVPVGHLSVLPSHRLRPATAAFT
jgi:hypothetical protein